MSETDKRALGSGDTGLSTDSKKLADLQTEDDKAEDEEEEEQPWEPTTAEDVLQYLRENLVNSFADAEFRESLLFDDELVGVDGSCYRVSVVESFWDGKPCYLVESQSRGVANGVRWKLHLTATVEIPSLGTIRQKRVFTVESCVADGSTDEDPPDAVECVTIVEMLKRPYTPVEEEPPKDVGEGEDEDGPTIATGESGENAEEPPPIPMHVTYRVSKTLKHEEDREESERLLTEEESAKFFPECALVVLLRCLAKLRFENLIIPLQMCDFDPDFELCDMTCLRGEDVVRSSSSSSEEDGLVLRFRVQHGHSDGVVYATETRHLPSGKVIYRNQDEPFMELSCLIEREVEEDDSKDADLDVKPKFEKTELVMEEDVELFSKYQDRMDELKASHGTYIRQHPELKTILSDFLQEVVTLKPAKFLPFAASYFSAFRQLENTSRKASRTSRARSQTASSVAASGECACDSPEFDEDDHL